MRAGEIVLLPGSDLSGEGGIVEQDIILVVEVEAAAVHVCRADETELTVDRQRFGVQQASLVLMDLDAGAKKIGVVAAACGGDDPRIVSRGKDDGRIDAEPSRRAQCIQ